MAMRACANEVGEGARVFFSVVYKGGGGIRKQNGAREESKERMGKNGKRQWKEWAQVEGMEMGRISEGRE